MGGSLAMPGPVPAAWMAARHFAKESVRATILVMFIVAYTIVLILQHAFAGISPDTYAQSAMLAPGVLAGVALGHFLSTRISEATFRWLLIGVLSATTALLFLSIDI